MASRHTSRGGLNGLLADYSNLRAVPALLGIAFAMFSLYQFGGISEIHIAWFDYTLETTHAMGGSLGVLAIAFASSETKQFENYEQWEQALIGATPVLVVGYEYVDPIAELINHTDPWTQVAAFLICVAGYSAAMR